MIASIWLDIHASIFENNNNDNNNNDYTDEIGTTKYSDFSFSFVPMTDMIIPVRASPIATYLHDDEKNFRNERLTYW